MIMIIVFRLCCSYLVIKIMWVMEEGKESFLNLSYNFLNLVVYFKLSVYFLFIFFIWKYRLFKGISLVLK